MPEPITVEFFAVLQDVEQGIREFEQSHQLQYVKHALSPDAGYAPLLSAFDLPELGYCKAGSVTQADRYLLLEAGLPVGVKPVPQRRGGTLYLIDQTTNPSAAFLSLGGIHQPGCLIAWQLLATSDPRSHVMFRECRRFLLRGFKKAKYAWVGPEAMRLYEQGWRLTQAAGRDPLYDLRIP